MRRPSHPFSIRQIRWILRRLRRRPPRPMGAFGAGSWLVGRFGGVPPTTLGRMRRLRRRAGQLLVNRRCPAPQKANYPHNDKNIIVKLNRTKAYLDITPDCKLLIAWETRVPRYPAPCGPKSSSQPLSKVLYVPQWPKLKKGIAINLFIVWLNCHAPPKKEYIGRMKRGPIESKPQ
uniref:Uncharacterized protein n=1 Tax=Trichoplax adhaerens TaxID=10228 RepID=Q1AGW6_TRIAD|nr:hypothetical protein [Trichoplax adhaerens]ABF48522.1 unknown [Trichoplax adhaerens]